MTPQTAHYLNRAWQYQPANSHSTAEAFAQRQKERLAAAQKSKPQRRK